MKYSSSSDFPSGKLHVRFTGRCIASIPPGLHKSYWKSIAVRLPSEACRVKSWLVLVLGSMASRLEILAVPKARSVFFVF